MSDDPTRDGQPPEPVVHEGVPPLDERALEALLDGAPPPGQPEPALTRLADLLAAAAGPARPDELAGEAVVLSAFRATRDRRRAHGVTSTPPRPGNGAGPGRGDPVTGRGSRRTGQGGAGRRRGGRRTARPLALLLPALLLLLLSATAAAAILTVRGAPADPPVPSTAAPDTGSGAAGPGRAPDGTTPATVTTRPAADPGPGRERRPAPAPPPEARAGLCRAWRAGEAGPGAPGRDGEAFRALVRAAGSADQIGAYCRGAGQPGPPTSLPDRGGRPEAPPSRGTGPPSRGTGSAPPAADRGAGGPGQGGP